MVMEPLGAEYDNALIDLGIGNQYFEFIPICTKRFKLMTILCTFQSRFISGPSVINQ